MAEAIRGIMLPFIGTMLGAALVLGMGKGIPRRLQRALAGFAAGVMVAASVWSLLLPAIDQAAGLGAWAFVPAAGGFWLGTLFLLALDRIVPRLRMRADRAAGRLSKDAMLVLAVTIHNIPEGMAVGAVYAGYLTGRGGVTALGAMSLALGIALQNIPEGAIISMPLRAAGLPKSRAFAGGALSGAVEPMGAALMLLAARRLIPVMPWCLSFAAGAMFYVVVEELIPEMSEAPRSDVGTVMFVVGFTVMMAMDVGL